MGIGLNSLPPPEAINALRESGSGDPQQELRQAIHCKYREEQRLEFDPLCNILLTGGARVGIAVAMLGLVDPGDIVVIPDPDYIGLVHMAEAVGASVRRFPIILPASGRLTIDFDCLAEALVGARMFAFTNPNNPMGGIWREEDLRELSRIADRNGTLLLCSEIYDKLIFESRPFVSLLANANLDHTLVINGTAKAYNLAGFGVGWMVCGSALHAYLQDLMILTHQAAPGVPSMRAASAVLAPGVRDSLPESQVGIMRKVARRYQDLLRRHTASGINLPQGGQFVFPDFATDDLALAIQLRREAGVLTVPGQIWGISGRGHLRLSLNPDPTRFEEGLERFDRILCSSLLKEAKQI
ncbi:pyridoxal phosphate-dependent aminotransferase [Aquisediminimonas profunda]|uniref:pyridoxal phosphate-dependent aminotransferase n=1 Tax=Aquisediminimonas profunda TaxID=1550733 RepID=UPI001C62966C|nr:pyridoxal phosphate-dependent aminotransferase [Aquisediminimonas profunda]